MNLRISLGDGGWGGTRHHERIFLDMSMFQLLFKQYPCGFPLKRATVDLFQHMLLVIDNHPFCYGLFP